MSKSMIPPVVRRQACAAQVAFIEVRRDRGYSAADLDAIAADCLAAHLTLAMYRECRRGGKYAPNVDDSGKVIWRVKP